MLYLHGSAVRLGQHDILDVLDPVALGQISGPAAVEEADTADVYRLLPKIDGASAHVAIGVADGGEHLLQCDVVGVELVQIDFDLEFLGGPAPGDDLDDALDGQEAALQDPVLNRAQIGQSEVWGPHYLIAENLADQARALDRGLHIVRKIDPLLQAQSGLRVSEIVIDPVLEHDSNE